MQRGVCSAVTPLEKAQELLDDLSGFAAAECHDLPSLRYTRMGPPVLACEALIVGVLNADPAELYGPLECNPSQLATYIFAAGLECSGVYDQSGADDPYKVAEVSAKMDAVGSLFWDWAAQYNAYLSKQWFVTWSINGDLGVITMQFTTGVD